MHDKPMNVCGMRIDQLYKNEELFCLMSALNIEQGIEGLRYKKVILATYKMSDGMHILLLITFFLTYFEGLVLQNHSTVSRDSPF